MVIAPVRVPAEAGLNVPLIVQFAPSATVAGDTGQLLVWAKSPIAAMVEMRSAAILRRLNMTICPGLIVPIAWLRKEISVGKRAIIGLFKRIETMLLLPPIAKSGMPSPSKSPVLIEAPPYPVAIGA